MSRDRRGVVLLLVLIVVAMLGLASLGFAELMLSEHRAAKASSRQAQARAFAESGAQIARQFLDRAPQDIQTAGGLYDNSQRFADQIVAEDKTPREQGRFSIVAPLQEDTAITGVRHGLQDESTRINLATILNYDKSAGSLNTSSDGTSDPNVSANDNTCAHLMLMGLPGMTDDVADAILDWIDGDDNPRDQGAESEYYSGLQPAYTPRNAPPASIEELLLIKGVTPELLYGYDAVKLGYSSSDTVSGAISSLGNNGSMDHGWAAYLTLWSAETTLQSDGVSPKINLNQKDMKTLYTQLSAVLDPSWAQFIVAYRQGGGTASGSGQQMNTTQFGQGINTLGSPLDLIGAKVSLLPQGGAQGRNVQSTPLQNPFTSDTSAMNQYLPQLFDVCTTVSGPAIPGRININQASRTVLMCIPGMTTEYADQIISNRACDPNSADAAAKPDQSCPAWPLIEGIIPLATMKTMLPYITAGGSVYRAQIVGHFDKGNPVSRLEVIIDATQHPAKVLFWKDMTQLNAAFPGEISGGTEGSAGSARPGGG